MKEKILPFIKKYPMSILLAIIALNLFSIAGSLKTEAELNRQKLICIEFHKNKIDAFETFRKLGATKGSNNVTASICRLSKKS
jgi:predicted RND superfamily exporter protein